MNKLTEVYTRINDQRFKRHVPPLPSIVDTQTQFKAWCKNVLGKDAIDTTVDKDKYNMATWIAYQVRNMWEAISLMFRGGMMPAIYIVIRSSSATKHTVRILYEVNNPPVKKSRKRNRDGGLLNRDLSGIDWSDERACVPPITSTPVPSPPIEHPALPIELIQWQTSTMKPLVLAAVPPKPRSTMATPASVATSGEISVSNIDNMESGELSRARILDVDEDADTSYTITAKDAENTGNLPLHIILSLLQQKQITLKQKPVPETLTELVQGDQWNAWFDAALSSTVFVAKTDAKDQISAFALTIDCSKSFPNAGVTQLKFSTACFTKACLKSNFDLPLGVLESTGTIGFGLDIGEDEWSLKTDLTSVINYIGLTASSNAALDFLGSKVPLTLKGTSAATDGARNAIWFTPAAAYTTLTRLRWTIDDVTQVQQKLEFLKGTFELVKADLITRRKCTYSTGPSGNTTVITEPQVILELEMNIVQKKFSATMEFDGDKLRLQITNNDRGVSDEIVDWLGKSISEDIPIMGWLNGIAKNILNNFHFRRISISVDKSLNIKTFQLAMEIALSLGASSANPARFLLTYSAVRGAGGSKLRGELWLSKFSTQPQSDIVHYIIPNCFIQGPLLAEDPNLLPEYEAATSLQPINTSTMTYLDLAQLDPESSITPPKGVPTQVREAFIEISSSDISIGGEITCTPPEASDVPTIALDLVTLDATYTLKGEDKGLLLSLMVDVTITPPAAAKHQDPFTIEGSLEYDDGNWTLLATTTPLYGGALYQFFDPAAQDSRGCQ